jgi:hypothetical protein
MNLFGPVVSIGDTDIQEKRDAIVGDGADSHWSVFEEAIAAACG